MPSIFYLDYENGLDATTNTPLGWWSRTYTNGNGTQPPAETTVTGDTSGSTATVTACTVSGGTWAGGNGAGTLYWYGKSAAFQAEGLTFSNGATCSIGGDFTYCAWKTITSGATAARIAPGDTIRIAKSPARVSIGNATWTNLSKTVTLASAQTLNIETCEANWTTVNATSATASATDWKEGSNKVSIVEDGTPGANEVQAYKATGTLNLSSYQKISFWIKNEVAISANQWEINLCTVNDGTGEVDTFPIPAIPSTGRWIPLTIARNGGGNLNAAIESINVSNGSGTPTASKYIYLDNIIACTTAGLNLQSLISKNANEQSSTASVNASEGWYGIQSINGTTVLLDNDTNTLANAGRGYSTGGTSPETVETYKRETVKTDLLSAMNAVSQQLQESGSSGVYTYYKGGYSNTTNEQIGETFFDGLNGNGTGLYCSDIQFNSLEHLSFIRYYSGIIVNTNNSNIITTSDCNNNAYYGLSITASHNNLLTILNTNNNTQHGIYCTGNNNIISILGCNNNGGSGISTSGKNVVLGTVNTRNNTSYGVNLSAAGNCKIQNLTSSGNNRGIYSDIGNHYIINASIAEATIVYGRTTYSNTTLYINNLTGTGSYIDTDDGIINSQSVTRHTASGIAWKFSPGSTRLSSYPLSMSIARIACTGGKAITFKAWMKKDHATNIACWLRVQGGQYSGIPSDVTVTKANDTDWEELTLPAFTPTNACVIEVLAEAWYVAGVSYAYIDDITISEAA